MSLASGDQQHLAGGSSTLKRAVSLGRLLEGKSCSNSNIERSTPNSLENRTRALFKFGAGCGEVGQRRARDHQGPQSVEPAQVKGRDRSARLAV